MAHYHCIVHPCLENVVQAVSIFPIPYNINFTLPRYGASTQAKMYVFIQSQGRHDAHIYLKIVYQSEMETAEPRATQNTQILSTRTTNFQPARDLSTGALLHTRQMYAQLL